MKNKVLDYFVNDGSFEAGKQLYINTPGASRAFIRQLQFQTDTKQNREVLHYELAKLAKVSLGQIKKKKLEARKQAAPIDPSPGQGLTTMNYFEKKKLLLDLGLSTPNMKAETITKVLEEHFSAEKSKKTTSEPIKSNNTPEGNE